MNYTKGMVSWLIIGLSILLSGCLSTGDNSRDESLMNYVVKHMTSSDKKNELMWILETFHAQSGKEEDATIQSIYDKSKAEDIDYIYVSVYHGDCFDGTVELEYLFVMQLYDIGKFNDLQLDKIIFLEAEQWRLLNRHIQGINSKVIFGSSISTGTSLVAIKCNRAGRKHYAVAFEPWSALQKPISDLDHFELMQFNYVLMLLSQCKKPSLRITMASFNESLYYPYYPLIERIGESPGELIAAYEKLYPDEVEISSDP